MSKNPPTLGGGFSYQERLIEAIDAYSFDPSVEVCFVGRIAAEKVRLTKKYHALSSYSFYRFFVLADKFGLIRLLSRITTTNWNRANANDFKRLKACGVDIRAP